MPTDWVNPTEAAVRLGVDPKTIKRRLVLGHRKHLESRRGTSGIEVAVPAKSTVGEVATALTVHAEREIQLAGSLVASVERERRTMRGIALASSGLALAAVACFAALWFIHAELNAELLIARADAKRAVDHAERESVGREAAEHDARFWRSASEDERLDRLLPDIFKPGFLAAE